VTRGGSRRFRRRGQSRDGLWQWTPDGIERAEVEDNPRTRPCTWCGAAPEHDCVRVVPGGRRESITGYHDGRAAPVEQEPAQKPSSSSAGAMKERE